jgi:hypothetical protein
MNASRFWIILGALVLAIVRLSSQTQGRPKLDLRQSPRQFVVDGEYNMPVNPPAVVPECERPAWSEGAFVRCEVDGVSSPTIHSVDLAGEDSLIVFSLPNARIIHVESIARGRNNALAIVGDAFDQNGHRGEFIAWVSPDRLTINALRTTGYIPRLVSLAPDGTIWTIGWERSDPNNELSRLNPDARVLRHFDTSGKLLDSFLPQRSIRTSRIDLTSNLGYLVSTSAGIGWYQGSGPYYELTFSDSRIVQYPGIPKHQHEYAVGLSLTETGSVFLGTAVYGDSELPRGYQLYELDRIRANWMLCTLPSGGYGAGRSVRFLGGDGHDTLMFAAAKNGVGLALVAK